MINGFETKGFNKNQTVCQGFDLLSGLDCKWFDRVGHYYIMYICRYLGMYIYVATWLGIFFMRCIVMYMY